MAGNQQQGISQLENSLKKAISILSSTEIQYGWVQVKQAAKRLVTGIDVLEKQEQNIDKNMIKSIMSQPAQALGISRFSGGQKAYILRAKYVLAFSFDMVLKNYEKQAPSKALIVANSTSGRLSSIEISMLELALRATASAKLGNISSLLLNGEQNDVEQAIEQQNLPREHIEKIQMAYQLTERRFNESKKDASTRNYIYFKEKASNKYRVGSISNKGDLKEAYATALLTEHKSNKDFFMRINIGDEEGLVETLYKNYITGVTNLPAIVAEDIVTNTAQYAVKSSGARMPGLKQYYNTAKMILGQKEPLSPQQIESVVKKSYPQDAVRNSLIDPLIEGEKQNVLDYIKKTLQQKF